MKRMLIVLLLLACAGIACAQEVEPAAPDNKEKADPAGDTQLRRMDLKLDDRSNLRIHFPPVYRDYARIYEGAFSTNDNLSYRLYSTENVLPGLMFSQRLGAGLSLSANETFSIHAGGYLMKYGYNFGYSPYYTGVFHLQADYRLTPWLTVGVYGQQAPLEKHNVRQGSILASPFVPGSSFGVTGTAMFNRTFGVSGVLGKEFDPWRGKWRTVYGIAPVINLNSLFK